MLNKYVKNVIKGETVMDLVTVRELYRNRDAYMDKEISIGG